MTRSPLRMVRILLGATIAVASLATVSAHAVGECLAPWINAPYAYDDGADLFSAGSEVTISWVADQNGGILIQAATDEDFEHVVYDSGKLKASSFGEHTVPGLAERRHYFRAKALRKGTASNPTCTESKWSHEVYDDQPVDVIQDATPPDVGFATTGDGNVCGVPVNPGRPVFCRQSDIWITGTAPDVPGGSAPRASGPATVIVTLVDTTPVIAAEPLTKQATVDVGNGWLVRYKGNEKPDTGTYSVFAQAGDEVGNFSPEPVELGLIVIL